MGLALRLALKQKFGATPKWPLGLLKVALLTSDSYHIVKTCGKRKKNRLDCHGNCMYDICCVHLS